MWSQQISEEHGDDSTTMDDHSDTDSKGKEKGKGKGRKIEGEDVMGFTPSLIAEEVSPAPSTADSTELIQVVVEEGDKNVPARQNSSVQVSSSVSNSPSSKNRKKKSNKKK